MPSASMSAGAITRASGRAGPPPGAGRRRAHDDLLRVLERPFHDLGVGAVGDAEADLDRLGLPSAPRMKTRPGRPGPPPRPDPGRATPAAAGRRRATAARATARPLCPIDLDPGGPEAERGVGHAEHVFLPLGDDPDVGGHAGQSF